MGISVEPISLVARLGTHPLQHIDYRLAETSEAKETIYRLRYRAYLREGAVAECPHQRVTDQYDDLPNSWTFGVYFFGELCSSVRISALTHEWRESCSAEAFGELLNPRLDRARLLLIRRASSQSPTRPSGFQSCLI